MTKGLTVRMLEEFMTMFHSGADKAAPAGEIARILGLDDIGSNGRRGRPGSRTLTFWFDRCREEGVPIVYNSQGYFLARTQGEAEFMLNDCDRRAEQWTRKAEAIRALELV